MKRQTVVIVDDDPWQAALHGRAVTRAGFEPTVCTSDLAVIEAIDDVQPVVIIADVLLSHNSVFALLHELQSHKDLAEIPVIICTNVASLFDGMQQLAPYGVRALLDKTTMHPDDLGVTIRRVLL